jgi:hypothetical protein
VDLIVEAKSEAFLIKSKANGLYIGFEGDPEEGKKLVVVERDIAKVWDLFLDSMTAYKYKQSVLCLYPPLSSISFDRIGLHDTTFTMEFPKSNGHPVTHAQLGRDLLGATNQMWIPTKGESCLEDCHAFILQLHPSSTSTNEIVDKV